MNKIARKHTVFGLVFAILGMLMRIYMAASHDHGQRATHAHVLLLGLVVSLLYGMVYRLWLPDEPSALATAQLVLHQAGTVGLTSGLFIMFGALLPTPTIEPVLAVASLAVLAGAVLMLVIFLRAGRATAQPAPPTPRHVPPQSARPSAP